MCRCYCRSIPSPAAGPLPPQVLGFPGSTASGVFILSTAPDSAQASPKSPPGMGSFTPAASQLRVGSSSKRSEAGSLTSDRRGLMPGSHVPCHAGETLHARSRHVYGPFFYIT